MRSIRQTHDPVRLAPLSEVPDHGEGPPDQGVRGMEDPDLRRLITNGIGSLVGTVDKSRDRLRKSS